MGMVEGVYTLILSGFAQLIPVLDAKPRHNHGKAASKHPRISDDCGIGSTKMYAQELRG